MQGSHIVQTIRQFDDDYAQIVGHRQKHFSQALNTAFLALVSNRGKFGNALTNLGDIIAKFFTNIIFRSFRIFNDIMQNTRLNRYQIRLQNRQNLGSFERMCDVRLATFSNLRSVSFARKNIRLPNNFFHFFGSLRFDITLRDFDEFMRKNIRLRVIQFFYFHNAKFIVRYYRKILKKSNFFMFLLRKFDNKSEIYSNIL